MKDADKPGALESALLHLGQAAILLGEAKLGYPAHAKLAAEHVDKAILQLLDAGSPFYAEVVALRGALKPGAEGAPVVMDVPALMDRVASELVNAKARLL